MLVSYYKKLVYIALLIGTNQIFAVEVLDNVEDKNVSKSSNVTKREDMSEGR